MYGEDRRMKKMGGGYADMMKKKKNMGGRITYAYGGGTGGDVKMDGCQPVYKGTPKAKAN